MGDPFGIGPEVVVKALAQEELRRAAKYVIVGTESCLRRAATQSRVPFEPSAVLRLEAPKAKEPRSALRGEVLRELSNALESARAGEIVLVDYAMDAKRVRLPTSHSALGGRLSWAYVRDVIALARSRGPARLSAVVTGPISKTSWALAGEGRYHGHTELFADALGSTRHAMMFESPELRVILVTAHIPLASVAGTLTTRRVREVIEIGHDACRRLGVRRPRLAVCGLNPHAGESGILGREDDRIIRPGVVAARRRGIDVEGPFPPDTIVRSAVHRPGKPGQFDLLVAMYHDQGLIPLKLLAFDHAVNMTVGLPVVRTSPDHGTAFDIAGTGRADAGSMKAAVKLAIQLSAEASPRHAHTRGR